ncbi:hypothetical protein [Streptomyces sp. W1SF4]|uniref:hypothetical protein n=1 Tax=Streptomyces sp. W1SF4 TaxID=2305220 RepID=UPI001F49966F|nr:hypothetical protein [Streptomyces sp. W1SF4]
MARVVALGSRFTGERHGCDEGVVVVMADNRSITRTSPITANGPVPGAAGRRTDAPEGPAVGSDIAWCSSSRPGDSRLSDRLPSARPSARTACQRSAVRV